MTSKGNINNHRWLTKGKSSTFTCHSNKKLFPGGRIGGRLVICASVPREPNTAQDHIYGQTRHQNICRICGGWVYHAWSPEGRASTSQREWLADGRVKWRHLSMVKIQPFTLLRLKFTYWHYAAFKLIRSALKWWADFWGEGSLALLSPGPPFPQLPSASEQAKQNPHTYKSDSRVGLQFPC